MHRNLLEELDMKLAWVWIALAVILAPCSFSGQATSTPEQSEIDSANRFFEAGKFVEAGKLYSRIAAQKPKDYSATSSWAALRCFPTGLAMRRNGWNKPQH